MSVLVTINDSAILSIEREILIDVLHNKGTSRDQVRYRLKGHSPVLINRLIEKLIRAEQLRYYSSVGMMEITDKGMKSIYAHNHGV